MLVQLIPAHYLHTCMRACQGIAKALERSSVAASPRGA